MAFYVYEHLRKDTGAVFYVGKGCGQRIRSKQGRSRYWWNVVEKVGYDSRYAASDLDEELAHLVECELISKYKALGLRLTNLTDGGEGMSGFVMPSESVERRAAKLRGRCRPDVSARLKGVPKSDEHRRKLSEAKKGRKASAEARRAMSESRKGRVSTMLGKRHRPETRAKIAAAVSGEKNPFFGRMHSIATRLRLSAAHTGAMASEATRKKMSASRQGSLNPAFGRSVSDERKARQIASLKARPRVECPHCRRVMDESNAKRWHLDKCRER